MKAITGVMPNADVIDWMQRTGGFALGEQAGLLVLALDEASE